MPEIIQGQVECGSCTACCRSQDISLIPGRDDPSLYDTETRINQATGQPDTMLKRQPNGDCIYLDREAGCTIWDKRPMLCRNFDCRVNYMRHRSNYTRNEWRRAMASGEFDAEIMEAGRKRLKRSA